MKEKQWYDLLKEYNSLVKQKEEYGNLFPYSSRLDEAKKSLFSQKEIFLTNAKCEVLDGKMRRNFIQVDNALKKINKIKCIYLHIENEYFISQEYIQNSYIKERFPYNLPYSVFFLLLIIYLLLILMFSNFGVI